MGNVDELATVSHVVSRDGTEIGFWTAGEGPPLVLVHGTGSLNTTWRPLVPLLLPHVTVHAVDRRGRGASGDTPAYDIARDYEDVAAVVDAVAEASGEAVDVLGHSFGGVCAFGAATLTSNVRRLVLYEGWPMADPEAWSPTLDWLDEVAARLDALLAEGDREALLEVFYREVGGLSEAELDTFRDVPGWWDARLAAAHTIPREMHVEASLRDVSRGRPVAVPTLLLVGEDSPGHIQADYQAVAAALPDARVTVLEGQGHVAHFLAPDLFAKHVLAFLAPHV